MLWNKLAFSVLTAAKLFVVSACFYFGLMSGSVPLDCLGAVFLLTWIYQARSFWLELRAAR